MTDVIVLHGAWHQPAHYTALATALRARGLDVALPDLHGLNLDESASLVEEIIAAAPEPPLVVGHSFGGITAGMVRGAASSVFLAAWLLAVGESPADLLDEFPDQVGADGLMVRTDWNGQLILAQADARAKLFRDLDDLEADRAVTMLRSEPPSIFRVSPTRVSWPDSPSLYIAGHDDRTIPAGLIQRFAARCGTSQTWPTGHSPHLSHTEVLADLLMRLRERPTSPEPGLPGP